MEPGDIVVLCSDGLNSMISDEQIEKLILEGAGDVEKICNDLINAANERGGHDNVTVVVVRCDEPGPYTSFGDEDDTIQTSAKAQADATLAIDEQAKTQTQ
jgi:serine/threonine protein phosphatase PrpC